jgi:hypothetical protein
MAIETLPSAVAEAAAFVLGKILRRSFKLEPQRAHRMGEWIIIGSLVTAGLIVTIIYS